MQIGGELLQEGGDRFTAGGEIADVAARAEQPSRPGQQDAAHIVVFVTEDRSFHQGARHIEVDGVAGLGTLQGQPQDRAVAPDVESGTGHWAPVA
ncbi:hypothetical protein D3C73_1418790 [compost metagenome]